MTLSKPTTHTDWCLSNPDPANRVVEPSGAKKQAGWFDDERPPASYFNWLFEIQDEWNKYFESKTDNAANGFDVVVGGGGADQTHATLQAANDDVAMGTNKSVLVKADYTVNTLISLTKAGWRIRFAPGVVYTKGSASTGLSLQAEGIEIERGRFVGFTGGSDIAIALTSAGNYCMIMGTRFGPSTNVEVDDSAVTNGKKPAITATRSEI